jgi:hypothetical protein
MNTKRVEVSLPFGRPDNLIEYIAWLNARLLEVPEEFRASAEVAITGHEGLSYDIHYHRPYTEDETKYYDDVREKMDKRSIEGAKQTLRGYQARYPDLVKL